MNEEEIINKLNNLIRILDKTCESGKSKEGSYIQSLLDLYTKQKQNIDKLQKENKEYQELTDNLRGENAELRDDLDELKRDNETLCEMAFIRPMPLPYTTPVFTSTDAYVSKEKVKNRVNKFVEKMNELLGE